MVFVGPELACRKLEALGIPDTCIVQVGAGDRKVVKAVTISGVPTLPTGPDVPDTTGYRIEFENRRSVYHASDTSFSRDLLRTVPAAEVFILCINGKWGNLDPEEASEVAARGKPVYAVPCHYDMMSLNSENPETFAWFVRQKAPDVQVKILKVLEPFVWTG
jgi:L-ascorbate metabolism protein UlaG (beta-lactamase superfamily)